jgi:hypothetical protein
LQNVITVFRNVASPPVPLPEHHPTRGARSHMVRGWRAGAKAHDSARQGGGGAHDCWRRDLRPAAAELGPATMAGGARKLGARGESAPAPAGGDGAPTAATCGARGTAARVPAGTRGALGVGGGQGEEGGVRRGRRVVGFAVI